MVADGENQFIIVCQDSALKDLIHCHTTTNIEYLGLTKSIFYWILQFFYIAANNDKFC